MTLKDIKKFFTKDTKSKIKFWRNSTKPRKGAPPKIKNWIEKNKNKKISKLIVCRKPVNGAIKNILNFVSNGKFKKSLKGLRYEDIFHLYLYITIGKKTWRIEKNAVVELKIDNRNINEDCMEINLKEIGGGGMQFSDSIITKNIKLGNFIENGKNYQKDFWSYNAASNNCQNFIESLLVGNKLIKKNNNIHKFIKQDSKAIFENNPKYLEKFSKTFTDLGGLFDVLLSKGFK